MWVKNSKKEQKKIGLLKAALQSGFNMNHLVLQAHLGPETFSHQTPSAFQVVPPELLLSGLPVRRLGAQALNRRAAASV